MVSATPYGRITTLLAAGLAAGLVLAGCGGSPDAAPSASVSGSAAPPAGAELLLDAVGVTVLDQAIAYPKKKPAEITSSIVIIEPGQETGWHRHNVPMYAYILDGTVTVEYDGGVTKEFPAGTAFMEAHRVFHNGMNRGDDTVRILVVFMGADGAKNTVQRAP